MKNFFGGMIERIKEKKGYFLLILKELLDDRKNKVPLVFFLEK